MTQTGFAKHDEVLDDGLLIIICGALGGVKEAILTSCPILARSDMNVTGTLQLAPATLALLELPETVRINVFTKTVA